MAVVLISWLYMVPVCMIAGAGFNLFWEKTTGYSFSSIEMYFLSGIALLGAYAQLFSLFSGVGAAANVVLAASCVILCILLRRRISARLRTLGDTVSGRLQAALKIKGNYSKRVAFVARVLLAVGIVILCAVLTAQTPVFYDSYLYHAQAIRWIEEYGCVAGLGNLHNRFAYNSSFLVLQALFSFRWLTGTSLHTLNGLIAAVFLLYSVLSLKLWNKRGLFVSDALRLAMIWYLFYYAENLSSPNTDTFALSLVIYLFTKWFDWLEEKEERPEPYAWACLMAVFACTLKLSSAFVLILLVKPIAMLIRNRRLREFLYCVLWALLLALPFFARNVMISGYVLYPYASIDLFPFLDWKMDAAAVEIDRKEICVWGRSIQYSGENYDVEALYAWPLTKWLPVWFGSLATVFKVLFAAAVLSSMGIIVQNAVGLVKTRKSRRQKLNSTNCALPSESARPEPKNCRFLSEDSQTDSNETFRLNSIEALRLNSNEDLQLNSHQELPLNSNKTQPGKESPHRPGSLDYLLVSLTSVVCLYGWLSSAPLVRYGGIYMLTVIVIFFCSMMQDVLEQIHAWEIAEEHRKSSVPPAEQCGEAVHGRATQGPSPQHAIREYDGASKVCPSHNIMKNHQETMPTPFIQSKAKQYTLSKDKFSRQSTCGAAVTVLIGVVLLFHCGKVMVHYYRTAGLSLAYQDYREVACEETLWEGYTIYTPVSGDQTDCNLFPAIPYANQLLNLEMRGDGLKDGFRLAEEPE